MSAPFFVGIGLMVIIGLGILISFNHHLRVEDKSH